MKVSENLISGSAGMLKKALQRSVADKNLFSGGMTVRCEGYA